MENLNDKNNSINSENFSSAKKSAAVSSEASGSGSNCSGASHLADTQFSGAFVVIAVLYVTCLLLSNLIAGKMWAPTQTITLPAAVMLFPITYIFGDIFTEVYGYRRARLVIWLGFLMSFFAVVVYMITIALPHPAFWQNQEAFKAVLGTTPRVFAASLTGYLFGEFSNSMILSKMKVRSQGKHLWMRTIASTIVGEAFDSVIFITISFYGTMPNKALATMIVCQYLFKVIMEAVFTPVTYAVVGRLKNIEGFDHYDTDVKYSVF
ncbi:MAG: queuosine precursor transporter [Eubacteriales bacterium]|nr:queuosine precursor transporter [Eubacteriales bacterium]